MPTPDEVRRVYDSMASTYDDVYSDGFYANQYRAYQRVLEHFSSDLRGRVLDLGCGTGIQSTWLASRAKRVVGIDISPRLLAEARTKTQGLTNVELVEADASCLPFDDRTFDAVVALGETLSHLGAPRTGFEEAIRVLRPGGRFLFSVLNKWYLGLLDSTEELSRAWNTQEGHVRLWTCEDDVGLPVGLNLRTFPRQEIERLGRAIGFRIDYMEGIHVTTMAYPIRTHRHSSLARAIWRVLGALDRSLATRRPLSGFGYTALYAARAVARPLPASAQE